MLPVAMPECGDNIVGGLRRYDAAPLGRTSRIAQVALESIWHMHNRRLADPAQAQVFMAAYSVRERHTDAMIGFIEMTRRR